MRLLARLDLVVRARLAEDVLTLSRESNELRAIFSKSLGTARANRRAAAEATWAPVEQSPTPSTMTR